MSQLPPYEALGGDATGVRVMDLLFQDYAEAGQGPNSGMGAWEGRTYYDIAAGMTIEGSIAKHRREWRTVLGLPPLPVPEAPVAPREFRGNFCGVRVDGLPPVPGGAPGDPSLVLSWFYDRYDENSRRAIRAAWAQRGYIDIVLSWPDSRSVGATPQSFAATCMELVQEGFLPTVFLLSKDYDPHYDVAGCLNNVNPVLPVLLSPRTCSRICIGWELSLWLSPTDVQQLTDAIAPRCVPVDVKCYVHFQQGYASFQQEGHTFADYWNRNVGFLTGILHQGSIDWSMDEYRWRLADVLDRFAGQFGCSPDSGFGHPFDCIAMEITAWKQYGGSCSEEEGNAWGRNALATTPTQGPFGPVSVMGSGNGQ